jgi:tRNA pseudouridine38-40 synthase
MVTKLTLEYDGTDFAGWARQPGLRTVQEELERVLRTILGAQGTDGEPMGVTVAGRTDRGVHAWGQVASYRHEAVDPLRLNGLLPDDVSVLASEPAPEGFDARRDARSRTYCYRVLARRARGVFMRGRALVTYHRPRGARPVRGGAGGDP